jgi:hypothetical protein
MSQEQIRKNTPSQYTELPLLPGVRSSYTKPLILELLDKGRGEVVLTLLHSVGLEVKETFSKPGFKLFQKRGRN